MPHFKDPKGALYWLDDHDAAWKKPDWTEIQDAEADAIRVANAPKPDRKAEINARLLAIDAGSVRALRAALVATSKGNAIAKGDKDKLQELETEAAALRTELAGLA